MSTELIKTVKQYSFPLSDEETEMAKHLTARIAAIKWMQM